MAERSAAVEGATGSTTAALRASGLSKSFAGVRALREVDFDLMPGEIHALVGENGAGKSTLAKIISGAYVADGGRLWLGDRELTGDPRRHAEAGIAMVYQEPRLVPALSAAANVFLGHPPSRAGFVDRRAAERRLAEIAHGVGIDVDPAAKAGELTLAKQRMLDVIRALHARAGILIMDEPSAALGPVERDGLYRTIERLREEQVTILFISHDLDEVFRLSDRISVMRDGVLVQTKPTTEWTPQAVVEAMLGRDFEVATRHKEAERSETEEALRVEGLRVPGGLEDVALTARRGEVLGIAGLVGSGRSTLLRALAGGEKHADGALWVDGRRVSWPTTVARGLRYGIVLSPEDRRRYGLVLGMTSAVNASITNLRAVTTWSFLRQRKLLAYAGALLKPLAFSESRLRVPAGFLSGGNQQKVVVARALGVGPRVLLLDEPTAGIDVGAKSEMFAIIDKLAADGLTVLFASSALEEVVEISDRILVLGRGRSLGMLEGERCSVRDILELAFGVEREAQAGAA
jgi:ABC-type sugar transport system ATPase subunit